jgi:AAA domain
MNIGREIVACALREQDITPFLDAGLTDAWLTSSNDLSRKAIFADLDFDAYRTLVEHYESHGRVMTTELFRRNFPEASYHLPDSEYTAAELIEQVYEGRKMWLSQIVSMDIATAVDKEQYDLLPGLYEEYRSQLNTLKGKDSRPYRRVTLAELAALPQPEPLIEGVMDKGTVTMLSGPFSTGKSFIALDWALSLASGSPWMGHDAEQARVLYISAEGAYGQTRRVEAWRELHPDAELDDNFEMIINPVQFGEPEHLAFLIADAKDFDVIVIDTVARCTTGLEENSTKDMGLFIEAAYRVKDALAAGNMGTVILVHHTGYNTSRSRGSSALPSGVDAAFLTESDDPHAMITMKSVKRKDGPPPSEVHMRLVESANSVVLESADAIFDEAYNHGGRSKQIIEYLEDHPLSHGKAIVDHLGDTRTAVYNTLKNLVELGQVLQKIDGRKKLYWLP